MLEVKYEHKRKGLGGKEVPGRFEITVPNNDPYSEHDTMTYVFDIKTATALLSGIKHAVMQYSLDNNPEYS